MSLGYGDLGAAGGTYLYNKLKGNSDKKPGWYQWWAGNTDAEALRSEVAKQYGGLDAFTDSDMTQMVINMYQSLESGKSTEQVASELSKFMANTAAGKKYLSAQNSFISSLKSQLGDSYDKTVYTDDKIKEMFRDKVNRGTGDLANVASYTNDIVTEINRDFSKKVEDGIYEADGTKITQGASDTYTQKIKDMVSNIGTGFSLSDSGIEYFSDMLKKNEAKAYEIEQMIKSSAEYTEYELKKARDEYGATLDTTLQAELDNLDKIDKSSAESVARSFETLAPTITKYAGSLGGTDRAFTTNALAEQAGELEQVRQDYLTTAEQTIRSNDTTRRDLLAQGRLQDAQNVTNYSQETGAQLFNNYYNSNSNIASKLSTLQSNTATTLAEQAQKRYDNALAKEQARLEQERKNVLNSAYKKAGKFGLFSSTLQGIVSGAMAGGTTGGVYGAIAGGVLSGGAGYASGYQNQKNLSLYGSTGIQNGYGTSNMNYSQIGSWGGSLFAK